MIRKRNICYENYDLEVSLDDDGLDVTIHAGFDLDTMKPLTDEQMDAIQEKDQTTLSWLYVGGN